jgi:RNA polymerase primary sigma factor
MFREELLEMYRRELSDIYKKVLSTLTETEIQVLCGRFGLYGLPEMTLQEIGDVIGKSKTRIMQLEARALRKLRHPTRSNLVYEFQMYL